MPAGRVTDLYRENLIGCDGGFMRVGSLAPSTRQRGVFQGCDIGSERLHVEAVDGRPAHQLIRVNHLRERLRRVVPRRAHLIVNVVSLPPQHREKAFELPGFGIRLEGLAAGGTRNALTRPGSLW